MKAIRVLAALTAFFAATIFTHSQTLINLKDELNTETFKEWDAYVKKYAPSDSAYRVVRTIATRHYVRRRYATARYAYQLYKPLFPKMEKTFDKFIDSYAEFMIGVPPTDDQLNLYNRYIVSEAPSENAFVAVQRVAENYVRKKQWDSAAAVYGAYKKFFPKMKKRFDDIVSILTAPTENLEINKFPMEINTDANEWDPNLTIDGKTIYFSGTGRYNSIGGHDIFFSRVRNGWWAPAQNVGGKINSAADETIDNIAPDGVTMMLSGTFSGTFGQFDIYMTTKTDSGWGDLVHLPAPINTEYVDEGGNLTIDGQTLVFTSDRPGGIGEFKPYGSTFHGGANGNQDIYVSFRTEDGWSEPLNLGESVNTPYSERSPYLHPDGRTLYFSSEGHPGIGDLDVFKTVRLGDGWTEWSEPVNLGKEINTPDDDWGYKVSVGGDSVLFARRDSGVFQDWDLYSMRLPERAKPRDIVSIVGKITDRTGRPVAAKMVWEDLETGEIKGSVAADPETGDYSVVLPYGANYGYFARKDGYYPVSGHVDLKSEIDDPRIRRDIILNSADEIIEDKLSIIVNNVFFDFDKSELKPESYPELKRLYDFLLMNPGRKVEIAGHTDNVGSEKYNKELSENRARAVYDYLKSLQKNNPKLETEFVVKGYGDEFPVADNDDEESRALNRRVEIRFLD